MENEEWKIMYALLVYCLPWQTKNKFLKNKEIEKDRGMKTKSFFGRQINISIGN